MKSNLMSSSAENNAGNDHLAPLKYARASVSFVEMTERLLTVDRPLSVRVRERLTRYFMIHSRLTSRPALASYVLIAMLVVACQVPTEYTQTVGQTMRVTTVGDHQDLVDFVKARVGDKLTDMNFLIEIGEDGVKSGSALFVFEGSPVDIEALIRDVKGLNGVRSVVIEPIEHNFRANLVSAAIHIAIHVAVDITDLTEVELQQVIEGQLQEQGIDGKVKVQLRKMDDGQAISIKVEVPADTESGAIQFDLKDDNTGDYKKQTQTVKVLKKSGNN